MTKQTAFYERLNALTDQWIDLFGYWVPAVITNPLEEYRAVRSAAGLMDFSMLRMIDIDGPGAVKLVNTVVTRDLTRLRPGQIAYGALCAEDGKMLDDCTVMIRDADHVRFCGANDRDMEILRKKSQAAGIQVREFTDDMPHLCIQGPASREILAPLASADISPDSFPYYTFREDVAIGGIPVFMTRMGYTAELGYELWPAREQAEALWDLLMKAGEPAGMKPVGAAALTMIRIEGGLILEGVEYDSTVSPYECGMGWSIALDKGDFQGRAALARDKESTRLRIASVVLDSGADQVSGAKLFSGGVEIGRITQAVASPYLAGRTLGLAEIDKDYKKEGIAVEARFDGAAIAGKVVSHPVYDPKRARATLS